MTYDSLTAPSWISHLVDSRCAHTQGNPTARVYIYINIYVRRCVCVLTQLPPTTPHHHNHHHHNIRAGWGNTLPPVTDVQQRHHAGSTTHITTHARTHAHTHTRKKYMQAHEYTCTSTHTYVTNAGESPPTLYTHARTHAHTQIYTHIYTHIHTHIHTHTHTCMHACTCAHSIETRIRVDD